MKRISVLLISVLLLLVSVSALADTDSVNLVVSLMQSQLPEDTADSQAKVYYDASADAVILDWKLTGFDSETVLEYAPLLKQQTSELFDSVAGVTESMRELLDTFDCPQSVLGMIRTKDDIPIAVFLNGATIFSI